MKMKMALALVGFLAGTTLAAAEMVDRVVAVVGDEIVTLSDVKGFKAEGSFEAKLAARETKDPLEAVIRERLLKQEIQRLGLTPTEKEIDGTVQEVMNRNRLTLEQLKGEIIKKGMSFERYRKSLSDQIREMKFMGQVIYPRIRLSDEEIARKAGGDSSEAGRFKARMELLQTRSSEEVIKYLDEIRAKSYVEIKK